LDECNGHIGTNVDGDDGVHGGYGLGERNADGFIFQTGGLIGMWKLKK